MLLKRKERVNKIVSIVIICILSVSIYGCQRSGNQSKEEKGKCTLLIECSTILKNIEQLAEGKRDIVPEDGIILKEKEVSFYEGDSVYDVLNRECKKNKIHIESTKTFGTGAYIEGIADLYEFDCGSASGWEYFVNDEYMGISCSSYKVKAGDKIGWHYTCNMGKDLEQRDENNTKE